MSKPEALILRRRGKDVRIRHDDPLRSRYSAVITRLQSAMTITTEVATLRVVMARERADDVQVVDDDGEVRGSCARRLPVAIRAPTYRAYHQGDQVRVGQRIAMHRVGSHAGERPPDSRLSLVARFETVTGRSRDSEASSP